MLPATRLLVVLALALATPLIGAAQPAPTRTMSTYEALWMETFAALLDLIASPDVTEGNIARFKSAQARLERAVIRVRGTTPPLDFIGDHVVLLPLVQEVTAAAHAIVDAYEAQDEPGTVSGREWFDQSLTRLQQVQRRTRPSAN